jgi:hypothetical protein
MPGQLEAGFLTAQNFGYMLFAILKLETASQQNV